MKAIFLRGRVWPAILLSGCLFLGAGCRLEAETRPQLRRVYVQPSGDYPIEARSVDSSAAADLLQTAESSYAVFLERMGLPRLENFKLVLEWSDAPQKYKPDAFDSFPRRMGLDVGDLRFRIATQGPLQAQREQIFRTCMICYLQSLELQGKLPADPQTVPDPPLWLSEGLTQLALKSREETFDAIVRRYQRLDRMPPLKTVQGWRELSDNSLEARWQQAFAYGLVRSLTTAAADKQTLVLWLTSDARNSSKPFLDPNQRNEAWWKESDGTAKRSFWFYDWDTTVAALTEALQVGLTAKDEKESRILSISNLPEPSQVVSTEPLSRKLEELTLLETRAHAAWVPVIEMYRAAVAAWLQPDLRSYRKAIARADAMEKGIGGYMRQVRDYLDYVMVNYPVDTGESEYADYREMIVSLENSRTMLRPGRQKVSTSAEQP